MAKQCKREGCNRTVFSDGYCKSDQYLSPKWQAKQKTSIHTIKRTPIRKKVYRIKSLSYKRKKEVDLYNTYTRPLFFSNSKNRVCRRCSKESTDIHHSQGKIGSLLNDMDYFIPLCRECHTWVEEHPKQAKQEGFSINRL